MAVADRRRRGRFLRVAAVSLVAGLAMVGCADAETPGTTSIPTSSGGEAPAETYGPGEARPVPTDGAIPESAPGATPPAQRTSELETLRFDTEDYTHLDWHVTCSGLDASPTIIATASDEADAEYVIVLIGAGNDTLMSFSVTVSAAGDGIRERAGLTVNPGNNQGSGSLVVDGKTVSSSGRGYAYDAEKVETEDATRYEFGVVCADE